MCTFMLDTQADAPYCPPFHALENLWNNGEKCPQPPLDRLTACISNTEHTNKFPGNSSHVYFIFNTAAKMSLYIVVSVVLCKLVLCGWTVNSGPQSMNHINKQTLPAYVITLSSARNIHPYYLVL